MKTLKRQWENNVRIVPRISVFSTFELGCVRSKNFLDRQREIDFGRPCEIIAENTPKSCTPKISSQILQRTQGESERNDNQV